MRMLHQRIIDPGGAAGPELVVLPVRVQTREASLGHLRVVGAPRD
jgi:hypothetical protein